MDTRVKPAYDAECVAASCENFRFKFQTAKRPLSRAAARGELLVYLPLREGRRNAERRALVLVPQLNSRIAESQRPRKRLSASRRGDFFVPGTVLPGAGASKLAIQAGFRPPFACPVQPLKAAPRSGHGRLPKAPRVRRARPPRPQAPHPAPRYTSVPATPLRVGRDT